MKRLLVANRAEIASRIFASARSLGISTVAIFSDADAGLPYVREADIACRLPGRAPSDTYLNGSAIIEAARAAGADAVHPGYGFLSENAAFATTCAAAGLVFVGPPPSVIEAMGSKLNAKALMSASSVPVLPGARVECAADIFSLAEETGWPLLLKASAGGGGRGMRRLDGPDGAGEALDSTRREALAGFGDDTIFAEKYLTQPRHIEVQILGDSHGNVTHLFERECSIQRRFQKIIEECPSPAVDEAMRAALGQAAVTAAKAIGYVGAGTVEFVVEGRAFYFLEVNTRLQVEHPVTESVTGIDLVAEQLRIASGERLDPTVLGAAISGHAIEARLYAEDVAGGFVPVAGKLWRFDVGTGTHVRIDSGYESGSTVSPHYDAMLAKVIAWAPERSQAAAILADALDRSRLHGLATNRDLLVGVLRHEEFLAGATDTGFLARHSPAELAGGSAVSEFSPVPAAACHAVAAALASQAQRRKAATVQSGIPSGWRNVPDRPQNVSYESDHGRFEVSYRVGRAGTARASVAWRAEPCSAEEPAKPVDVAVSSWRPDSAVISLGGVDVAVQVATYESERAIFADSTLGHTVLYEIPRFPDPTSKDGTGTLLSPMPGTVSRVTVTIGDSVTKGSVLLYLEAMKMEHPVLAPASGKVSELRVSAGHQVEAGALLAVIGTPPPAEASQ